MPFCPTCNNLRKPTDSRTNSFDISLVKPSGNEGCPFCSILTEALSAFGIDLDVDKDKVWIEMTWLHGILSLGIINEAEPNINTVQIYTRPDESWHEIGPTKDIAGFTRSAANIDDAKHWLRRCFDEHSTCRKSAPDWQPHRLLEMSLWPLSVKLHESADSECSPYAALSHCWGGIQPLKTTMATLDDHKQAIEASRLPRAFQDAIEMAQTLGIKYIWIDSLCIIQDSTDDWAIESAQMAKIYSNATVTLLAVATPNNTESIFRHRETQTLAYRRTLDDGSAFVLKARQAPLHSQYLHWSRAWQEVGWPRLPLLERGWVFQEYLLSPRLLKFGPEELLWTCDSMLDCNCGFGRKETMDSVDHRRLIRQIFLRAIRQPDEVLSEETHKEELDITRCYVTSRIHHLWWHVVEIYTTKALTFGKDKLPALSGVASYLSGFGLGKYYAGLWDKTLADDLFWRAHARVDKPERDTDHTSPHGHGEWRAPSWCWASANTRIFHSGLTDQEHKAKIVRICCEPATADPFGSVRQAAHIVVKGRLLPATAQLLSKISAVLVHAAEDRALVGDIGLKWYPDPGVEIVAGQRKVFPVEVLWWAFGTDRAARALVLYRQDGDELNTKTYRRVGVIWSAEVLVTQVHIPFSTFDWWSEVRTWLTSQECSEATIF